MIGIHLQASANLIMPNPRFKDRPVTFDKIGELPGASNAVGFNFNVYRRIEKSTNIKYFPAIAISDTHLRFSTTAEALGRNVRFVPYTPNRYKFMVQLSCNMYRFLKTLDKLFTFDPEMVAETLDSDDASYYTPKYS